MGTASVTAVDGRLVGWVAREEGFRSHPYRCSEGALTVGYGLNLDAGISREEAELLLRHRLGRVAEAVDLLRWTDDLDEVRRGVLVAMTYQLGVKGLLKFTATLRAVEWGEWEQASKLMLASKWARQTPGRARRTAEAMRTGAWPSDSNLHSDVRSR